MGCPHVVSFVSYNTLAINKNTFTIMASFWKAVKRLKAISCEVKRGLHKCVYEVTCDKFAFSLINI